MASQALADRLARARRAAGHTQLECAELLKSRFGAPDRSQASVSRYLSGKQEMPIDIAHAVSEYIRIFDPDGSASAGGTSGDDQVADDPAQEFAGLVRRLTDEPLLGPRQGALLDALIVRLRDGPPMSSEDGTALTQAMRVLGLDE